MQDPLFTLTQHEFHQPTERNEWRTLSAGIEELTLNAGADRRTVLQRYAPGAETHMVHTHSYYEEVGYLALLFPPIPCVNLMPIQVYLLEGTLTDRTLGEEWQRGAYAYRRPHMPHGPYTSRTGCTMFVTCSGEGA